MKQIIKGKLYDTQTAKKLAEASSNLSCTDFGYWEEELYRKKTGEYFVHGHGGPMSHYARSTGTNSWSGGEGVRPISYDGAKKWAEDNLSADKYIELFGNPESDETESLYITIPKAIARRIRDEASQNGDTISNTIAAKFRA